MNISFIAAILASAYISSEAAAAVLSARCQDVTNLITGPNKPSLKKLMSHTTVRALAVADVDHHCINAIEQAIAAAYTEGDHPKAWRAVWSSKPFVRKAADNGDYHVSHLRINNTPIEALSTFLNHKKYGQLNCRNLNRIQIQHLALNKKKAAIIKPQCFAEFDHDVDLGKKGVSRFKKNIFSLYEGSFHESWYNMTKEQLIDFSSNKALKEYRCAQNFDCGMLGNKLFKAIPKDCFCNWMENNPHVLEKKQMKEVTVDHLKACKSHVVESGLSTLIGGNWKWVRKEVIDYMTTDIDLAGKVSHKAIYAGSKVTKSSFFYMTSNAQLKVMEIVKDLPDDLFAEIIPAQISAWDNSAVCKKEKKHCTKYQCFELVRDRSNIKSLMANIPLYNCVDVSFEKLRGSWTFGEHMTRACYKDMSVDADKLADFDQVHENVLQFVPSDLVRRAFASDYIEFAAYYMKARGKNYKHPSVWRGVLRNPKVCRDLITPKVFRTLRKEKKIGALEGFSSACVRQIKFIADLQEDEIKAFGPQVYSTFTKNDKNKISFKKSTNQQLANISSGVTNLADHFASQVRSLQNYSDELVGMMSESWFRAFPAETWGTISASQVGVIKASYLSNIGHEKWSKLSPAAQKALTGEQVTVMGVQCGDEKAQVEALKGFTLNDDGAKALKARSETDPDGAVRVVGAGLLSVAAGLALLTPLL